MIEHAETMALADEVKSPLNDFISPPISL